MGSCNVLELLPKLYPILISLLPEKFRNTLSLELHKRLCVNDFEVVFYDNRLIESMGRNCPSSSAIGDHICTIFSDVIIQKPSFIVELGTRGGESTKALLAAAYYSEAIVLSIDLSEQPQLELPPDLRKLWRFVQSDDIDFGKNHFVNWCESNDIKPVIDFLFIDSSHLYKHTSQEIDTWFKFLSKDAVVVLHDTNMAEEYRRINNTIGHGWNNDRGVIRAIEDYFGKSLDEGKVFVDVEKNWLLRNYPYSSGLIFLKRLGKSI